MSLFNDNLKKIKIKNLAIFIVIAYGILFVLSSWNDNISANWFYVIVIGYFMIVLRNSLNGLKEDISTIFSKIQLKYILLIVFLNIFLSYGMLYLSQGIINYFPFLDFLVSFSIPSMSLVNYLPLFGGFISTVIISPISEELIFRGVFLNRLRLFVPTVFAVIITSLLFGALHSFGSMISAVIFAICMAILYLKTENICVPIFAHFLNNFFAEIIRMADVNNVLFINGPVMIFVGILAIISTIILISAIVKELSNFK